MDRKVLMVTFFRCDADEELNGECELCRRCHCDRKGRTAYEVGFVVDDTATQIARDLIIFRDIASNGCC